MSKTIKDIRKHNRNIRWRNREEEKQDIIHRKTMSRLDPNKPLNRIEIRKIRRKIKQEYRLRLKNITLKGFRN